MTLWRPHAEAGRIRDAVRSIAQDGLFAAVDRVAFRTASPRFASAARICDGRGSLRHPGRWLPPGVTRGVYLSLSPLAAVGEALGFAEDRNLPPESALPQVLVAARVRLERGLDLGLPMVRRRLGVTVAALGGDAWVGAALSSSGRGEPTPRETLTQAIGREAFEAGFDGLIAPTAAARAGDGDRRTLLVFPDAGGTVRVLRAEELP